MRKGFDKQAMSQTVVDPFRCGLSDRLFWVLEEFETAIQNKDSQKQSNAVYHNLRWRTHTFYRVIFKLALVRLFSAKSDSLLHVKLGMLEGFPYGDSCKPSKVSGGQP